MGATLAIWKPKHSTSSELALEFCEAICQDEPHDAIERFDMTSFEKDIYDEFGVRRDIGEGNEPFILTVGDYTDCAANWAFLEMSYDRVDEIKDRLLKIAKKYGLIVFYSDAEEVWS